MKILKNLPEEIKMEIVLFLRISDFPKIFSLCKDFFILDSRHFFWREIFFRDFPGSFVKFGILQEKEEKDFLLKKNLKWKEIIKFFSNSGQLFDFSKINSKDLHLYDTNLFLRKEIAIIGDHDIGKKSFSKETSILMDLGGKKNNYIKSDFDVFPTVIFDNKSKKIIQVHFNHRGKRELYFFRMIPLNNFFLSNAFVFLFDITNYDSFSFLHSQFEYMKNQKEKWRGENNPKILVGTHLDKTLLDPKDENYSKRRVSKEEAHKFALSLNCPYYEISTNNENDGDKENKEKIEKIFCYLLRKSLNETPKMTYGINLEDFMIKKEDPKKKKCYFM